MSMYEIGVSFYVVQLAAVPQYASINQPGGVDHHPHLLPFILWTHLAISQMLDRMSLQKMRVLLLSCALLLVRPCLCYHLFDSRDSLARSVIEACRNQTPNERAQCYTMLRCIMDNIPSDFTARWSAGASILSFIPTIVGLMSNSISEITSIADESVFLAIALSISSTTAFNSRFGDRPKWPSNSSFKKQREHHARIQTALSNLEDLLAQPRRPYPWWRSSKMQIYASILIAVVIGAAVWYEVYQITRYGVVVFACPVKVNIGVWVGLSQLLTLLNVVCRSFLFDIHTIHVRTGDTGLRRPPNTPPLNATRSSIVLRCPRNTFLQWPLQTFTTITSYILYAYGTTLLASMTLIPASDAIRAMVISTSSAGFGRLAGSWFASPRGRASQIIAIDVPADCLQDFRRILEKYNIRDTLSSRYPHPYSTERPASLLAPLDAVTGSGQ